MNIDTEELQKAVIAQAVASLVDSFGNPEDTIGTEINNRAKEHILKRCNEAMEVEIKRVIDSGLEKIVFPQTNAYGEEKRPDMTLREFIASRVESVFTEYLDSNGNPTKEAWYRKPENMRVNKVIEEAVKNSIRDEVIAAAKAIQTKIHHYVGEFVKVQLNEAAGRFK